MLKKPQIFLQLISAIFICAYALALVTQPIYGVDVTDLENQEAQIKQQIEEKKGVLSSIEKRISEISNSNYTVSQKIALINEEITKLDDSITSNEKALNTKLAEIEAKQALLELKKTSIDTLSSELYIQSRFRVSTFFLSDKKWDEMIKDFFVKKNAIGLLKDEVEQINGEFSSLTESKAELESQKTDLEEEKQGLADSYDLLLQEKSKLQAELKNQTSTKNSVSSSINSLMSQLSTLQKALIAARLGGTFVNPDSVPSGSDRGSLSSFIAKAPSGSFGVFSIGAYTNRVGLSQYGAKARAEAPYYQNYTTILDDYYPGYTLQRQKVPLKIKVRFCDLVNGSTVCSSCKNERIVEYDFEDYYMKGIYEMPENWPYETIKAQVIAARTYALRVTSNGATAIRADECGQVFKPQLKTGNWAKAVVETQGGDKAKPYVLKNSSGSYASGMFALLSGGWVTGDGKGWWDTTDGSGGGDWMSRAWDSLSGVSWFYKIWYRTGYTTGTGVDSGSCNRNPWMSQAEMADILNSYMLWKEIDLKGSVDFSRVYPPFDACHSSGNPYSYSQVKALINNPVTSISYAVVSNGNGTTNSITFGTNRGSMVINGNDFKYIYNLRAPGYLRIPQNNFVFINIEMK